MNVFDLRDRLLADYAGYTRSFIKIADPRIAAKVDSSLNAGSFWPEPLLQLNPTFLPGGTVADLVASGALHPECDRIFRVDKTDTDHTGKALLLHTHQREAILKAKQDKSYVLTSGTGSGKSLAYIVPTVDHAAEDRLEPGPTVAEGSRTLSFIQTGRKLKSARCTGRSYSASRTAYVALLWRLGG